MTDKTSKHGVLFALGAYFMWGFAPLFFKLLDDIPAPEILMHRVIWSLLVLVLLIAIGKKWQNVQAIVFNTKTLLMLLLSGSLLATNWLVFIWSVNNDHLLDASLGYYINPLLNVFLAYVILVHAILFFQWSNNINKSLSLINATHFFISWFLIQCFKF